MQHNPTAQAQKSPSEAFDRGPANAIPSPARTEEVVREAHTADSCSRASGPPSFVGEQSLLAHDAMKESALAKGILPRYAPRNNPILQFTEATVLPKEPLLTALIDSYCENVFHRYPVADRADLTDPDCSKLLKQAVCMAGSLMRHSSTAHGLAFTETLYEKAKTMLFLNFESDPVATLGAMCLMICWSRQPTDALSLDCPWHWTGMAIRLALQMGLHKESTYTNQPESHRLRRIWWILLNADRLQGACFGRPLAVRASDCDTRLPSTADFDGEDISTLVFIHYASITTQWGEIADFGMKGKSATENDLQRLADSLILWITTLPDALRLYDASGTRQPYRQSVSELHQVYFSSIILLEALRMKTYEHWSTSIPSMVAASCIARLVEEVDCRADLSSMSSTTTFYILAASIPLLYYRSICPEKREIQREELQILCSALEQMSPKYGGAVVVRRNIEKIHQMVEAYRSRQQDEHEDQPTNPSASMQHQQREKLFPFPKTICPSMELLDSSANEHSDSTILLPSLGDEVLPWNYVDAQSYLDLFRINDYSDLFNSMEASLEPMATESM